MGRLAPVKRPAMEVLCEVTNPHPYYNMELIYPEFLRFKDRVAATLCRISWDVILIQGFRLDGHVYNARWGSIPLHLTFNMPEYRESANPPHCKCGVHDTAGAAPASGTTWVALRSLLNEIKVLLLPAKIHYLIGGE